LTGRVSNIPPIFRQIRTIMVCTRSEMIRGHIPELSAGI
jgi:hypothetical protein